MDLGILGEVSYCPNGCPVTIGIDSVNIDPIPSDTVNITIMLSPLSVPIDLNVLFDCDVVADTGGQPMAVTAELTYGIDPYTRLFWFDVLVGDVDTNNIDIHGTGGWNLCGAVVGGVANLIKPLLESTINGMIEDEVNKMVDDIKCVGCPQEEGDAPCNAADGYSCNADRGSAGICQLGNGQCQPAMFGLDAEIDVGTLAGGAIPGLASRIMVEFGPGWRGEQRVRRRNEPRPVRRNDDPRRLPGPLHRTAIHGHQPGGKPGSDQLEPPQQPADAFHGQRGPCRKTAGSSGLYVEQQRPALPEHRPKPGRRGRFPQPGHLLPVARVP